MKKFKVNKEACISCGACFGMFPEIFTEGSDDKAEVKIDVVPENLQEEAMDALEGCPTGAIVCEEEND